VPAGSVLVYHDVEEAGPSRTSGTTHCNLFSPHERVSVADPDGIAALPIAEWRHASSGHARWNDVGTQRWQPPATGGNGAGAKALEIAKNGD
jgi:hypothetical protein